MVYDYSVPSRDVNNQTILGGINLIIPGQGEFGKRLLAGDGTITNLFLQCTAVGSAYITLSAIHVLSSRYITAPVPANWE
jgi:hypothetical protein